MSYPIHPQRFSGLIGELRYHLMMWARHSPVFKTTENVWDAFGWSFASRPYISTNKPHIIRAVKQEWGKLRQNSCITSFKACPEKWEVALHCTVDMPYWHVSPDCLSSVMCILCLNLFPCPYVPFHEATCFNTFCNFFFNKSWVILCRTLCINLLIQLYMKPYMRFFKMTVYSPSLGFAHQCMP